jgi:proteasome lid subunit RPN8/RPN11
MSVIERKSRARPKLAITASVLEEIRQTVGSQHAEQGGVLGGNRADGVVRHFHFDRFARRTGANYSPDHELLNRLFAEQWNPAGINFLGFVHSHPAGLRRLSRGDLEYARRILGCIPDLHRLLLPLVMTEPDTGSFELIPYGVVRDGNGLRVERMELEVLAAEQPTAEAAKARDDGEPRRTSSPLAVEVRGLAECPVPEVRFPGAHLLGETFVRVQEAYDLGRLAVSRVIHVGTGGAGSFIEDLARAGVGEHVLIDPDTVSVSNLATQQVYRRDVGRPKVDCLAERIRDINPQAVVAICPRRLDELTDEEVRRLALEPLRRWDVPASSAGDSQRSPWGLESGSVSVQVSVRPAVTLLCGLTDSFPAQARINRLALQFALPSLCAQVYQEGRGAEVTFTYPGVTPACHRCALRGRYKAYLEGGFRNDVTSDGTPIFATARLNALKGFIALAILHHGTAHPRWGGLLERIGRRNLVQVRMDPDLSLSVFGRVFSGADPERVLFDEAVWLPQEADGPATGLPACPECGGTGDLRNAWGTFSDTRDMPS